jgi:hypothetical protein
MGHSGFSTLSVIVFLYLGCAWLLGGLAVLVVCRLCRMPSLFRMSTVLPAGKARTCGTNSQAFWSNTGFFAGASSFFPFAAFTTTTTLAMPPPESTSSSGFAFSLPHTSGSFEGTSFCGAGGVPSYFTVPDRVPPSVTAIAS